MTSGQETAGFVLAAVGMALPLLMKGELPAMLNAWLPKPERCPFCGWRTKSVGPLPMIGCSNEKCPVRPGVNSAQLMMEGLGLPSKEGALRFAELWNRRA